MHSAVCTISCTAARAIDDWDTPHTTVPTDAASREVEGRSPAAEPANLPVLEPEATTLATSAQPSRTPELPIEDHVHHDIPSVSDETMSRVRAAFEALDRIERAQQDKAEHVTRFMTMLAARAARARDRSTRLVERAAARRVTARDRRMQTEHEAILSTVMGDEQVQHTEHTESQSHQSAALNMAGVPATGDAEEPADAVVERRAEADPLVAVRAAEAVCDDAQTRAIQMASASAELRAIDDASSQAVLAVQMAAEQQVLEQAMAAAVHQQEGANVADGTDASALEPAHKVEKDDSTKDAASATIPLAELQREVPLSAIGKVDAAAVQALEPVESHPRIETALSVHDGEMMKPTKMANATPRGRPYPTAIALIKKHHEHLNTLKRDKFYCYVLCEMQCRDEHGGFDALW